MSQATQPNLKTQVTSGILWSGGARIAQQILQFGLSVILARLLSPAEYGLMAMVMVFTGFAGMLADAGFNPALVQRKDLRQEHIHTVFWITLGSGFLLTTVTFLLAPLLAAFFKTPTLAPIFQAISLNFIFGGLGNVPSALLQRRMEFRLIAKVEIGALIISGVMGVAMAMTGMGVWSLVGQSLASALLIGVFRCWASRWLPKPIFCRTAFKEIWEFSGSLYGFNFINYWGRNADNLIVGKFFGAPALGAYNRAYALMLLPITQINSIISQVIFPALSSIQGDKERVKRIYLRAIGIVTFLGFPIMMGLMVVAKPFVLTVYGPKWIEVAGILQILAPVGAMQVLFNSTGWLFLSQGRTGVMFLWGGLFAGAAIISFCVGAFLGSVKMVALCYAAVNVAYFYPCLMVGGRVIATNAYEILAAVSGSFLCALAMAALVAGIRFTLPVTWKPWLVLFCLVSVGGIVYLLMAYFLRLSALTELRMVIREKLGHDSKRL